MDLVKQLKRKELLFFGDIEKSPDVYHQIVEMLQLLKIYAAVAQRGKATSRDSKKKRAMPLVEAAAAEEDHDCESLGISSSTPTPTPSHHLSRPYLSLSNCKVSEPDKLQQCVCVCVLELYRERERG